ncbi:hypothetical protein ACHAXN_008842 [Cyclotella atomus]
MNISWLPLVRDSLESTIRFPIPVVDSASRKAGVQSITDAANRIIAAGNTSGITTRNDSTSLDMSSSAGGLNL